jgi:maltodextrin utilization protein YvdJ
LVSHKEVNVVIDTLIENKFNEWLEDNFSIESDKLHDKFMNKINNVEGRLIVYIESKINNLYENIVNKIITKTFEDEVERRVNKKLKERGNF